MMDEIAMLNNLAERGNDACYWILMSAAAHLNGYDLRDGNPSTTWSYFWSKQDSPETAIARCDKEIAEMKAQPPVRPAYLVALGIFDWELERSLILKYQAAASVWRWPMRSSCPFCRGYGHICTTCETAPCDCETPAAEMCGACKGAGDL